jgi:hypothetical protein
MTSPVAFGPNFSKTKTISATATSSSVTLDATDVSSTPSVSSATPAFVGAASGGHSVMRIVNAGPNTAFIRFGVGAQTAVTTDMPLMAGMSELFSKAADTNTVAAICASAQTATVYITCGEGL